MVLKLVVLFFALVLANPASAISISIVLASAISGLSSWPYSAWTRYPANLLSASGILFAGYLAWNNPAIVAFRFMEKFGPLDSLNRKGIAAALVVVAAWLAYRAAILFFRAVKFFLGFLVVEGSDSVTGLDMPSAAHPDLRARK